MRTIESFIELVKEHPDLDVMTFVNRDVVPDDEFPYCLGDFADSCVEEVCQVGNEWFFKSDIGELEEFLCNKYMDEYMYLSDDEYNRMISDMALDQDWKKVIVLYIEA